MFLLVVVSLNSFFSHDYYFIEDSFRWCVILLCVSGSLVAAALTDSSGVRVRFVIYLCLKNTVPENLGARLSFTHRFQHR